MWIDTHCHLDAAALAPAGDALRQRARRLGVAHLVIPAVRRGNWAAVRALARRHGDSYALGIHPLHAAEAQEEDIEALRALLLQCRDDPQLVALGEIGLDFFHPDADRQRQHALFVRQLALACEFGLPVILHVRKAIDAALHTLRQHPGLVGGIAHAFNGSVQQAREWMARGFFLGFGGAVTHGRAKKLQRLAAQLPLEGLVLETDAPDMPPAWLYLPASQRISGQISGQIPVPNSPAELPRIAQCVAALRGVSEAELARATGRNARAALRGLPGMG